MRVCLPLALGAVVAVVLAWWRTRYGPAVGPDGVMYLETAQSLLAGRGFYAEGAPMTHYAPGYPLLLALAGLLNGGNVFGASRLLHALLLAVNTVLVGAAIQQSTQRNSAATVAAMLLFVSSQAVAKAHTTVSSEPLFLTLALIALLLLARYHTRTSWRPLLLAVLTLGLAMATRYAGVALLAPLLAGLCLNQTVRQRPGWGLLALAIACAPLGLWLARNALVTGATVDRALVSHPVNAEFMSDFVRTLQGFFLPVTMPDWARIVTLALGAATLGIAWAMALRAGTGRVDDRVEPLLSPLLWTTFALAYVALLALTRSFVDAQMPADGRILLPLWVAAIIATLPVIWTASRALRRRGIWWGCLALVLLCIGLNGQITLERSRAWHRNGSGFGSKAWRRSETIAAVRELPGELTVYSNGADTIRFLTNREAVTVPRRINPNSLQPYPDYEARLQAMCQAARKREAVVVELEDITWRWYLPTREEVVQRCELVALRELKDGVVYGATGE
jgi:hypothetical protein